MHIANEKQMLARELKVRRVDCIRVTSLCRALSVGGYAVWPANLRTTHSATFAGGSSLRKYHLVQQTNVYH